jgi:hypothetical protein
LLFRLDSALEDLGLEEHDALGAGFGGLGHIYNLSRWLLGLELSEDALQVNLLGLASEDSLSKDFRRFLSKNSVGFVIDLERVLSPHSLRSKAVLVVVVL